MRSREHENVFEITTSLPKQKRVILSIMPLADTITWGTGASPARVTGMKKRERLSGEDKGNTQIEYWKESRDRHAWNVHDNINTHNTFFHLRRTTSKPFVASKPSIQDEIYCWTPYRMTEQGEHSNTITTPSDPSKGRAVYRNAHDGGGRGKQERKRKFGTKKANQRESHAVHSQDRSTRERSQGIQFINQSQKRVSAFDGGSIGAVQLRSPMVVAVIYT